jgi:hypothetical protein
MVSPAIGFHPKAVTTHHRLGGHPRVAMIEPAGLPHYEIRVRGRLGPTLLEAFPTLTAHPCCDGTLLAGPLADNSALYGLLRQIEALGLELVEVRRADTNGHR